MISCKRKNVWKVWLDILADFLAVSVGGIEILVSLTAIDHLLFYFKECSLTGGFFLHLYLSKCSHSKPCKLLLFCLSFSFNKLHNHKWISIFLTVYWKCTLGQNTSCRQTYVKFYVHGFWLQNTQIWLLSRTSGGDISTYTCKFILIQR